MDEPQFCVRYAMLDHLIPSVAYLLEEKRHINIWKSRLDEKGLRVGPWLRDLKAAILAGEGDDTPIRVMAREGERLVSLGELRHTVVRTEPGQKVAYVTDAARHDANAERIVELVSGADILFIETPFLQEDAAVASEKNHLTAARAGELARTRRCRAHCPVSLFGAVSRRPGTRPGSPGRFRGILALTVY